MSPTIIFSLALVSFITSTTGLKCYSCSFPCDEELANTEDCPHNCLLFREDVQEVEVTDHYLDLTILTVKSMESRWKRGCTTAGQELGCVQRTGHGRTGEKIIHHVCVCSEDLCNSALTSVPTLLSLALLLLLLGLLLLLAPLALPK